MDFSLFLSVRFWQLGIAGIGAGLGVYATTGDVLLAVAATLTYWATGSVVVRTADRNSGTE